jgi:hypothetical protein
VLDVYGQAPADVARVAFDALARGQLIAPTNALSEGFVGELHNEVLQAMQALTQHPD